MKNEACACPGPISAIACGSLGVGVLLMILAVVSRLTGMTILTMGQRSFAAGAFLFLQLSTAVHLCKGVCFNKSGV